MDLKQREHTDHVIDLTNEAFYAPTSGPSTTILRTLPDHIDLTAAHSRARYGELGIAATVRGRRRRFATARRHFDTLTVFAICMVAAVGALMLTAVATFRH